MDTIYALSTGNPPCGVSVIRVSGSAVTDILSDLGLAELEVRTLVLRAIFDREGVLIDTGLIAFFPAPRSFTGEDCLEFQVHGSRAVIDALFDYLRTFRNVRPAEPGEFTMRAFENGKIDLTAAEGLADVIHAETKAQLAIANAESIGEVFQLYRGYIDRLLEIQASLEATIDFSDEDDVDDALTSDVMGRIDRLLADIRTHLEGRNRSRQIRNGYRIAIVGAPNAGKSTLLNTLAGHDRVIVSDIPGTTRDVVEVRLNIADHLVLLSDTAGIRSSDDVLEQEGIRRSLEAVREADLVLNLVEPGGSPVTEIDAERVIVVWTKADLLMERDLSDRNIISLSCKTGAGIDQLVDIIKNQLVAVSDQATDFLPVQERHVSHLEMAVSALSDFDTATAQPEIVSEAVRRAAHEIGSITGRYGVEDVLGAIFSRFCIGK